MRLAEIAKAPGKTAHRNAQRKTLANAPTGHAQEFRPAYGHPAPQPAEPAEMADAAFLVMPSEWYETFGLTIVEAFSQTLPVIASRLGAMAEIVEDGVTGLHFTPGDAADLAAKVRWANEHPEEMRQMGANARRVYEAKYTPERNYPQMMEIYETAIAEASRRRPASP